MEHIMLIDQIIQRGYIEFVDLIKNTMEQYVIYSFYTIEEEMKDNPNYFYKKTDFLNLILDLPQLSINNEDKNRRIIK